MPPKNDPQRDKVYWLEGELDGWRAHSSATTRELESLLFMVCRYYEVDPPRFKVVRRRRWADAGEYDPARDEIVLNRSRQGANALMLLHETAHYLIECLYRMNDVEDHGPEFVSIYMHVLDHFGFLPHMCFRMLAKKHRLKTARRYRPIAFKKEYGGII